MRLSRPRNFQPLEYRYQERVDVKGKKNKTIKHNILLVVDSAYIILSRLVDKKPVVPLPGERILGGLSENVMNNNNIILLQILNRIIL